MHVRLAAALLLAFSWGCHKASAPAFAVPDAGEDDEVRPVYSAAATVPDARRLCEVLYQLPLDRRAACCSARPSATFALSQCTLTLSAAVGAGAVILDAKAVTACAAAQADELTGCDWVGPNPPALPPVCRDLLRGTRKAGDVCRSSLECADGAYCRGAGPTQTGRCGPPKQDGQACRLGVDALAGYVREDEGLHHPECAGFCGHYRCAPRASPGGACRMSGECPAGERCNGTKCVAGVAAQAGEACGGGCAEGLRCVNGRCQAPFAAGAGCALDAECKAGCLPTHVCGLRCD